MAALPVPPSRDAEQASEDNMSATSRNEKPEVMADVSASPDGDADSVNSSLRPVPLSWKLASIVLVTAIGFGSQWSSGITGAMKSTIKKEMDINNKQFALLEASEDFMVTALMLVSGVVTDRIGGAGMKWLKTQSWKEAWLTYTQVRCCTETFFTRSARSSWQRRPRHAPTNS